MAVVAGRSTRSLERTEVLAESVEISSAKEASEIFDGGVARYCTFSSYLHEGAHVDAVLVGCKFVDVEWYWALFNCTILVDCEFVRCTFQGASFSGARLVDCRFERCRFIDDNLGAPCRNHESKIYGGEVKECSGSEFLFGSGAL